MKNELSSFLSRKPPYSLLALKKRENNHEDKIVDILDNCVRSNRRLDIRCGSISLVLKKKSFSNLVSSYNSVKFNKKGPLLLEALTLFGWMRGLEPPTLRTTI